MGPPPSIANDQDFWQRSSTVPCPTDELVPGFVRIDLTTTVPVAAELVLEFTDSDRPPLAQSFETLSPTQYSMILRLDSRCSRADIRFVPPVAAHVVGGIRITRLGYLAQAALAVRKIAANLRTPASLVIKLRQVLWGGGSLRFRLPGYVQLNDDEAYALWQRIYESPEQQKRVRGALMKAVEGRREPRFLVVYATACRAQNALDDFLDTFSEQSTAAGTVSRFRLLVFENADDALRPDDKKRIEAFGGTIVQQEKASLSRQRLQAAAHDESVDAIVFLETPGRHSPLAFDAFALELFRNDQCLAVYADSDRIDSNKQRSLPSFTPRWSPEYYLSYNYVGGGFAFAPAALDLPGVPNEMTPGACAFSLALGLTDSERWKAVQRIPRILFHETVAAGASEACRRRFECECAVLARWLENSQSSTSVQPMEIAELHTRHLVYPLPEPAPRISVIIPSKDSPELLRDSTHSVLASGYPNLELIVIDNGSSDPGQLRLLQSLEADAGALVLSCRAPFNYSALNNFGRRSASGDVLLFLNDDVKTDESGWIKELVSLTMRPDTGCVGALLLYPDGSVQHAGVTLGPGGVAGHAFRYFSVTADVRIKVRREVSAVTGACLAIRSEVFDEVGGFDEKLVVALNDIDLCLRVRERGYRNLFTPHAVLTHYESMTRGKDVSPQQIRRLEREIALFVEAWGEAIMDDPYYSPHLTRIAEDFRLRTA